MDPRLWIATSPTSEVVHWWSAQDGKKPHPSDRPLCGQTVPVVSVDGGPPFRRPTPESLRRPQCLSCLRVARTAGYDIWSREPNPDVPLDQLQIRAALADLYEWGWGLVQSALHRDQVMTAARDAGHGVGSMLLPDGWWLVELVRRGGSSRGRRA